MQDQYLQKSREIWRWSDRIKKSSVNSMHFSSIPAFNQYFWFRENKVYMYSTININGRTPILEWLTVKCHWHQEVFCSRIYKQSIFIDCNRYFFFKWACSVAFKQRISDRNTANYFVFLFTREAAIISVRYMYQSVFKYLITFISALRNISLTPYPVWHEVFFISISI